MGRSIGPPEPADWARVQQNLDQRAKGSRSTTWVAGFGVGCAADHDNITYRGRRHIGLYFEGNDVEAEEETKELARVLKRHLCFDRSDLVPIPKAGSKAYMNNFLHQLIAEQHRHSTELLFLTYNGHGVARRGGLMISQ